MAFAIDKSRSTIVNARVDVFAFNATSNNQNEQQVVCEMKSTWLTTY